MRLNAAYAANVPRGARYVMSRGVSSGASAGKQCRRLLFMLRRRLRRDMLLARSVYLDIYDIFALLMLLP